MCVPQLNHFSLHLIFPSAAPVICIPLSFPLSATSNFPFYHLHSCPLFPPPTGPVQCLRQGRWPPLGSQALLWRLVLLVPGQIQPRQETPYHGSYAVHPPTSYCNACVGICSPEQMIWSPLEADFKGSRSFKMVNLSI